MKELLNIGNRVEMLVDDYLIDCMEKLEFRLTPLTMHDLAIETDKPWEGSGSMAYPTFLQFNGKYFCYYRANRNESGKDEDPGQYLCVALSDDGIHWEKPELDLIPFGDCPKTNILMSGYESGVVCHNFTPVVDENPDCPADEKIKAVGGYAPDGLFVFVSADGFHFRKFCETPAITGELLDSQNVLFYDTVHKCYRIYSRWWNGLRAIQSRTSQDCIHWSEPVNNMYTNGVQTEHLYTNATTPCPGAEHILLSTPMRFEENRARPLIRLSAGVSDGVFMTSRDGHLWDRRFLDSWIPAGRDPKCWTQRNRMPAHGILCLDDEEFTIFANEHNGWPDAGLRRYSVRKFGFASLYAGGEEGTWQTKPILWDGGMLHLNFRTSAVGMIRVAMLNAETGEPFEGFTEADCGEIYGDELKEPVRFQGADWSMLKNKPVVFRFTMRLADLYAIQSIRE